MHQRAKISILGAGNVGSSLAQKISTANISDVVLWNRGTKSQGIVLDLLQSGAHAIHGTNDYGDTANSDIIVITAGVSRTSHMSRDELFRVNAAIVTEITENTIAYSPNAVLLVVTNPLDVMTYIAWNVSGLSSKRVMGISGTLDSARFKAFIAKKLGITSEGIQALVIGSHNDCMIPLPRYCSVGGVPLQSLMDIETIHHIVERTRQGGSEIVNLMQRSAYYAPANSIYEVIEAIVLNQPKILPVSTYLAQGEYGLSNVFLGTPCLIGRQGIEKVFELQLTDSELELLHYSSQLVLRNTGFYRELV
jgi:malate dehydrogenase